MRRSGTSLPTLQGGHDRARRAHRLTQGLSRGPGPHDSLAAAGVGRARLLDAYALHGSAAQRDGIRRREPVWRRRPHRGAPRLHAHRDRRHGGDALRRDERHLRHPYAVRIRGVRPERPAHRCSAGQRRRSTRLARCRWRLAHRRRQPPRRDHGADRRPRTEWWYAPRIDRARFVHTTALGFDVVPNPTLRPETAWSFEIGHTSAPLWHIMRLDAALFWTEARNLIEPQLLQIPPSTVEIQLQNVVHARIAGLDANVIAAPIPDRLIATLGYTYLDTRRRLAGDSTSGPLAFRPRHLLTLAADYIIGPGEVGADFRFASRPERIELEGFVDPRRVPVKVLDLRASWRQGPVEFRLLATNVLNYIYNLVPETLAPVRTVTLTAVWSH